MKHIPNILSAFRIVLIPFFIWRLLAGDTVAAGSILLLSGITDFLDGQLARRFGWITPLGKVLDPAADKLTQVSISLTFAVLLRDYWYFFVILLAKDALMLLVGGYFLKKGIKLSGAKWFGKVSTFVFYVAMILLVFLPAMPRWIIMSLLVVVVVSAVVSVLLYIPDFLHYRKEIHSE